MTYRICYDDGLATNARDREAMQRSEYFRTEFEALRRARQLLEDGDHHGIAVHDESGSILTGVLLQLNSEQRWPSSTSFKNEKGRRACTDAGPSRRYAPKPFCCPGRIGVIYQLGHCDDVLTRLPQSDNPKSDNTLMENHWLGFFGSPPCALEARVFFV